MWVKIWTNEKQDIARAVWVAEEKYPVVLFLKKINFFLFLCFLFLISLLVLTSTFYLVSIIESSLE